MTGELIPFPDQPGANGSSNGSAQLRVVPYPAQTRVVQEHEGHTLDAWDQLVRLVPLVQNLIDLILSLGILFDARHQSPAEVWLQNYWGLLAELIQARQAIDVAALKRDYGPGAPPIAPYDDNSTRRSPPPSRIWTGSSRSSTSSWPRSTRPSGT